eukprot:m.1241346 g.1241346  ORF g.1241346 m.1241346 type:complete len:1174 (-) comp24677_c0_seq4:188-3709(-)
MHLMTSRFGIHFHRPMRSKSHTMKLSLYILWMSSTLLGLNCHFCGVWGSSLPPDFSRGGIGASNSTTIRPSSTDTVSSVTTIPFAASSSQDLPRTATMSWNDDFTPTLNASTLPSCRCASDAYFGNETDGIYCELSATFVDDDDDEYYFDFATYLCSDPDSGCVSDDDYVDARYCTRRDPQLTTTEPTTLTPSPTLVLSPPASTRTPQHVTQFQHGCYNASSTSSTQFFCVTSELCSMDAARLNTALGGFYFACVGYNLYTKHVGLEATTAIEQLNNHTIGAPFRCRSTTGGCCQVVCRESPSRPNSCLAAVQDVNTLIAFESISNSNILTVSPFVYVPICSDGKSVPFPTCLQSCCAPSNMTFGRYGTSSQGCRVNRTSSGDDAHPVNTRCLLDCHANYDCARARCSAERPVCQSTYSTMYTADYTCTTTSPTASPTTSPTGVSPPVSLPTHVPTAPPTATGVTTTRTAAVISTRPLSSRGVSTSLSTTASLTSLEWTRAATTTISPTHTTSAISTAGTSSSVVQVGGVAEACGDTAINCSAFGDPAARCFRGAYCVCTAGFWCAVRGSNGTVTNRNVRCGNAFGTATVGVNWTLGTCMSQSRFVPSSMAASASTVPSPQRTSVVNILSSSTMQPVSTHGATPMSTQTTLNPAVTANPSALSGESTADVVVILIVALILVLLVIIVILLCRRNHQSQTHRRLASKPQHLELVVNQAYSPPFGTKTRRKFSSGSRSSVPSIITAPPQNGLTYTAAVDDTHTQVLPLYGVSDDLDRAEPYVYQSPDTLRRGSNASEHIYATSPTRHLSKENVFATDSSGEEDRLYEYQSAVDTLSPKSSAADCYFFSASVPVSPEYGKALSEHACIPTTAGCAVAVHGRREDGASVAAEYSLAQSSSGAPPVTVDYSTTEQRKPDTTMDGNGYVEATFGTSKPATTVDASGYVQAPLGTPHVAHTDDDDLVFEGVSNLPLGSDARADRQDSVDDVPVAPVYSQKTAILDHDTSDSTPDCSAQGFYSAATQGKLQGDGFYNAIVPTSPTGDVDTGVAGSSIGLVRAEKTGHIYSLPTPTTPPAEGFGFVLSDPMADEDSVSDDTGARAENSSPQSVPEDLSDASVLRRESGDGYNGWGEDDIANEDETSLTDDYLDVDGSAPTDPSDYTAAADVTTAAIKRNSWC